ncbi:hypothetical protein [Ochrobactrum sp. EDr1-4]|uniref:hypothetical protein n=1 Tax=Ochrobactrum sp. EDr1-4 TaxID=3368622 RepID=UPI003BA07EE2
MNRRSFLSFLSLAPVAVAVPAMALPRSDKSTDIEKLTVTVSVDTTDMQKVIEGIRRDVDREVLRSIPKYKARGFL